jgi:hypothetical protein
MSVAVENGTVLMLIALLAIPFAAIAFSGAGEVYRSINKGALTIGSDLPLPRYLRRPEQAVDPAIQAAEVRQMLRAKSERLQRRNERPLDVEAEADRLIGAAAAIPDKEAMLRGEVQNLVITRNERRMRKGLEPLDVEAETERQLTDFVGSP